MQLGPITGSPLSSMDSIMMTFRGVLRTHKVQGSND
jgi:hypothetical protein